MNIDVAILGGMGPQAGANYFKILTDLFSTDKGDQEHPQVLLYSNSKQLIEIMTNHTKSLMLA